MSEKVKLKIDENDLELFKEIYNQVFQNDENIEFEMIEGKAQCLDIIVDAGLTISIYFIAHSLEKIEWNKISEFFEKLKNKNAKVKIKTKEGELELKNISQDIVELLIKNLFERNDK